MSQIPEANTYIYIYIHMYVHIYIYTIYTKIERLYEGLYASHLATAWQEFVVHAQVKEASAVGGIASKTTLKANTAQPGDARND